MIKYDICIIGGGAAGLAAAASFNKGLKVCILEKNDRLGRKIAATGGGRCNLTNLECENRIEVLDFFRNLGMETRADEEGRCYPYSGRASDVVETLTAALGTDITVKYGFRVESIRATDDRIFEITGPDTVFADRVLLATGGKAAPQYGTTGDGYAIAGSLGHTINRVYPILSPIECSREGTDFRKLKGIRAVGSVTLLKDGNPVSSEKGEIQFTEDGLSGICVFNLTRFIRAESGEKPVDSMKRYTVEVDFAPDFSEEDVAIRKTGFGIVTGKLAEVVKPSELKHWTVQVIGVKGWRNAQCTAGGVATGSINMNTMESNIIKGLYFAGEILDCQGPCGGFNLQNAWETGIRAAKAINSTAGK